MSITILDLVPTACPDADPCGDIRPEWKHGWNACRDAMRERLAKLSVYEKNMLILALARGHQC